MELLHRIGDCDMTGAAVFPRDSLPAEKILHLQISDTLLYHDFPKETTTHAHNKIILTFL